MGSKNYAKYATDRYLSWTLDNQINYNKTFGKHNLGVTLLQSASKYNKESIPKVLTPSLMKILNGTTWAV